MTDNTIDSEVKDILWNFGIWEDLPDRKLIKISKELKNYIEHKIAQEANKAVVAKLNELLEMGENFYFPYGHSDEVLEAHIKALTADKEQAG